MELELYEYLPGGRRHKRHKALLAEFRRGLAEAIGTFSIVLISCLGNASPHTSELGACAVVCVRACACAVAFMCVR
jgi:hypothetical protein